MRLPAALATAMLWLAVPAHAAPPNDPGYPTQWGLERIRVESSWRVSTGAGAMVAIVDTGVDPSHPDLEGKVRPGRDFADDDDDARDDNGHGTLVAGIVGAWTGNRIGVASVAPDAIILPVRVLDRNGNGNSQSVAAGIRWAVAQGARVINLSLAQGPNGIFAGAGELLANPSVDRAIQDAATAGAVVVVAAGNDARGGRPQTAYDSDHPAVLVVGASTVRDRRAAYSNYGSGLDVLAPGGGSHSDPSDAACTQRNAIVSTYWNPQTRRAGYGGGCGTSMAVGFVSGVAAQLAARGFGNVAIAERIRQTADDVGSRGIDNETGFGRLNAAKALGPGATKAKSKVNSSVSRRSDGPARAAPVRDAPAFSGSKSARRGTASKGGGAAVNAGPSAGSPPLRGPSFGAPHLLDRPSAAAHVEARRQPREGARATATLLAVLALLAHVVRWAVARARA